MDDKLMMMMRMMMKLYYLNFQCVVKMMMVHGNNKDSDDENYDEWCWRPPRTTTKYSVALDDYNCAYYYGFSVSAQDLLGPVSLLQYNLPYFPWSSSIVRDKMSYRNRAAMIFFQNVPHNISHSTSRVEISWKWPLSRHGQRTPDWIDKTKRQSIEASNTFKLCFIIVDSGNIDAYTRQR